MRSKRKANRSGRLSRSKDQPELHGLDVSVPDLADGPAGPVVVTLPSLAIYDQIAATVGEAA